MKNFMKIASWNVNSIRVRIEHIVKFLKDHDIDVLLLQEIKCINEVFPNSIFQDMGYNCEVFGQKTYNGVAILSKYLIEDVTLGSSVFEDDPQSRYIEALINGYNISSVYVPNGQEPNTNAYFYKLDFLKVLSNYIKNKTNFIIGGDFNIALSDQDVYDPKSWKDKICCTSRERECLNNFIQNNQLKDSISNFRKNDEKIYTWWDYRHSMFQKDKGLRLDYFFVSQNIIIENMFVEKSMRSLERPSDHAPIIMII